MVYEVGLQNLYITVQLCSDAPYVYIVQLVEHSTDNREVASPSLAVDTNFFKKALKCMSIKVYRGPFFTITLMLSN